MSNEMGDYSGLLGGGPTKNEPNEEVEEGKNGVGVGGGGEIFCGRIPKDVSEEEITKLFQSFGPISHIRLMLSSAPQTGNKSRGYGFINYERKADAAKAILKLNGKEIRPRQYLNVTKCVTKCRLFVGNIPKSKGKDELFSEFDKRTIGLKEVIIYKCPDDEKENRGFCFLEYESHRDASNAKRRLSVPPSKIWGCDILVDWADPEPNVDEETMERVKVLYVRNLTSNVSEPLLRDLFAQFGPLERVKRIKDYAFVHFNEREHAEAALDKLENYVFMGVPIQVTWAKPPTDKQKRQEILRARERRMLQLFANRPVKAAMNPFVSGSKYERGEGEEEDASPYFQPNSSPPPSDNFYERRERELMRHFGDGDEGCFSAPPFGTELRQRSSATQTSPHSNSALWRIRQMRN